ncbi:MAG: hypothetical protein AB1486_25070 [Planctomycetota bacterium]
MSCWLLSTTILVWRPMDGEHLRVAIVEWPKRAFESWWSETRRQWPPRGVGTSFLYRVGSVRSMTCRDDSWKPTQQLLEPRYWHTAVWTGSEMIVWGGMGPTQQGSLYCACPGR